MESRDSGVWRYLLAHRYYPKFRPKFPGRYRAEYRHQSTRITGGSLMVVSTTAFLPFLSLLEYSPACGLGGVEGLCSYNNFMYYTHAITVSLASQREES